ncbi:hypothetical protein K1X76_03415 [bacterium]|nr:hypothetical protein [bacterium]
MVTQNLDFLVNVKGLNDLPQKRQIIQTLLKEIGFCVIRGVFNPEEVISEYKKHYSYFKSSEDLRRSGPIVERMKNFQRVDCGDYSQCNARLSRMFTRFFWNPDDTFSWCFKVLQQLRDILTERKVAYSDGMYTLNGTKYYEFPKILHYPVGGGFMNEHFDAYNNDGIFNIGMSVTRKGIDYKAGGVYYKRKTGEEILIDDFSQPGDIYIHDAQAVHGVHAIDSDCPLDLSTMAGRVTLILSSESFPTS